jgi:hypothetical protein
VGHSGHYKKRGRRGRHGTIMSFELKAAGEDWVHVAGSAPLACAVPTAAAGTQGQHVADAVHNAKEFHTCGVRER